MKIESSVDLSNCQLRIGVSTYDIREAVLFTVEIQATDSYTIHSITTTYTRSQLKRLSQLIQTALEKC